MSRDDAFTALEKVMAKRHANAEPAVPLPIPRAESVAPPPVTDEPQLTAREILHQAGMVSAAQLDRKVFPPM